MLEEEEDPSCPGAPVASHTREPVPQEPRKRRKRRKGLGMRRKCHACENVARAYLGAKVNVAPRIGVSMRENVARAYLGAYAYAYVRVRA